MLLKNCYFCIVNSFHATGLFLYLLNLWFYDVFSGSIEREQWYEMV